ncbi:hypothetical protein FISHEDRAFT_58406 [Fistulina hepatica ATCC 64428]|nr:hypothetical protein FISHEDRAFT_58406 [Fistulina hepatica ATCC 64428]
MVQHYVGTDRLGLEGDERLLQDFHMIGTPAAWEHDQLAAENAQIYIGEKRLRKLSTTLPGNPSNSERKDGLDVKRDREIGDADGGVTVSQTHERREKMSVSHGRCVRGSRSGVGVVSTVIYKPVIIDLDAAIRRHALCVQCGDTAGNPCTNAFREIEGQICAEHEDRLWEKKTVSIWVMYLSNMMKEGWINLRELEMQEKNNVR